MRLTHFYPTPDRRVLIVYEHAGEEGWYPIPVEEAARLMRQLKQAIEDSREDSRQQHEQIPDVSGFNRGPEDP